GKFIHSPRPGAEVRVESMGIAYWAKRFDGARRVATPNGAAAETPGATPLPAEVQALAAPAPLR
ncbi:MAG: peptidoglycan endopeptidase, partial [Rhodoferax sp.]